MIHLRYTTWDVHDCLQEDSGSEDDEDEEEALLKDGAEPVLVVPEILMTLEADDQEDEGTGLEDVVNITGLGQLDVPMVKVGELWDVLGKS